MKVFQSVKLLIDSCVHIYELIIFYGGLRTYGKTNAHQ